MPLAQLINRPVVIESRAASGELDEGGAEVDDVISFETVAELQPRSVSEPTMHPDVSDSDWIGWFFPIDAEYLDSGSVIWAPGLGDYEVVGKSPTWRNPRTQSDEFVEVKLNRVAGPGDSEGS